MRGRLLNRNTSLVRPTSQDFTPLINGQILRAFEGMHHGSGLGTGWVLGGKGLSQVPTADPVGKGGLGFSLNGRRARDFLLLPVDLNGRRKFVTKAFQKGDGQAFPLGFAVNRAFGGV